MIYISRLLLNARSRAVMRDLSDCHDLHRTLLSAFPELTPGDSSGARDRFGVLYRPETDSHNHIQVLVQSMVKPDWSRLPSGYLLDTDGQPENPACKQVDGSYQRLRDGTTLLFRLRANPTKRVWNTGEPGHERWKGKRVDLRKEGEQLEWLRRKGEQGGFQPFSFRVRPDSNNVYDVRTAQGRNVYGSRPANGGKTGRLTFGSVIFDGRLRITDVERFRQTLEGGIGSGKAYGFGLLSIAPER